MSKLNQKPLFSGFFLSSSRRFQLSFPRRPESRTLNNPQKGISLIELIIVIVVIGALSAVVAVKYFDSTETAHDQNMASIAGALNSASARNYTRFKLGKSHTEINNCTDAASLLPKGLPSGYSIASKALTTSDPSACTLSSTFSSNTEVFMGIGVSG